MKKEKLVISLMSLALLLSSAIVIASKVYAHCDTMGGPVIKDAKAALEKKDVTPVLKWVSKEKEPEVRAAFETTLVERAKGSESQEKADIKFFETLIRIHREGEGTAFTGIKLAEAIEPIELEADQALEAGSVSSLTSELSENLINGVKERFDRVTEKKKYLNDSVEAGREYVEAYVEYLHYIEGIHKAIAAKGEHQHEE